MGLCLVDLRKRVDVSRHNRGGAEILDRIARNLGKHKAKLYSLPLRKSLRFDMRKRNACGLLIIDLGPLFGAEGAIWMRLKLPLVALLDCFELSFR